MNYDREIKNLEYLTAVHTYNKMYGFPLVIAKPGVPTKFQIDDSRSKMVSPISDRQSKHYLPVDDLNQINKDKASRAKLVAAFEVVLAQSQKDNAPPNKSVFEHMQNIALCRIICISVCI